MATIQSIVKTALASTSIPVFWPKWDGQGDPPDQYFAFSVMNYTDEYGDDVPGERVYYIYLDLYSTTEYSGKIASIRTGMTAQGFDPVDERDVPEQDGYHLSTTWVYREAI